MKILPENTVGMRWAELMTFDIDWEGFIPVVTYVIDKKGEHLMVADIVEDDTEDYWSVHIVESERCGNVEYKIDYFSKNYYPTIHDALVSEENINIIIEKWKK
jgi:hypothetical protein